MKIKVIGSSGETLNIFFKELETALTTSFKENHLKLAIVYFSLAYLGVELDDFEQVEKYVEKLKLMDGLGHFKKNLIYLQSFLEKVSSRN